MTDTVSLICTVRDEADNIAALLDSMLSQSRLPDEIIINDCGSRDATANIVRGYARGDPRITLVAGGHNISSGRNNAILAASGSLIACTDAGLVLDQKWLSHIIAPLEHDTADLVGGFFRPAPHSLFELVLGATNYRNVDEIDPARFLPFGKSMAFRREVWQTVGGFPEWASHCEDVIFDMATERAGYRRAFAPQALVYFRPRSSLQAFAQQYFLYARGDGLAGLWGKRHAIRYTTYLTLLPMLWAARRWAGLRWLVAPLVMLGGAAYTRGPYRRLWPQIQTRPWHERMQALALVPLLRLVGDVAKMVGYPFGLYVRRWRQRNSAERWSKRP
jgi:glycosyltransferase involved in cell wall biosynthesis